MIAIIAVLMGVLLPSLNRARQQARKIACLSNLRQMGVAVSAYLTDSDYRLPPSSCHIDDPNDHWLRILADYTREQLLFHCPSDTAKDFVDWDKPLDEQKDARYSSFAVNALLDPIHYRYGARRNRYNDTNQIRRPMRSPRHGQFQFGRPYPPRNVGRLGRIRPAVHRLGPAQGHVELPLRRRTCR